MEDNSEIGQASLKSLKHQNIDQELCQNNSESGEPKRKKRCIRFANSQNFEDPSLISDSGFSEISSSHINSNIEHGDFLGVTQLENTTELFEDTNQGLCVVDEDDRGSVRTSIDTVSLHADLNDLPDPEVDPDLSSEDPDTADSVISATTLRSTSSSSPPSTSTTTTTTNISSSTDSNNKTILIHNEEGNSSIASSSSSSSSSSSNSNFGSCSSSTNTPTPTYIDRDFSNSTASSSNNNSNNTTNIINNEKVWGDIFAHKEIQGHPSRMALMQRFLSHLRSNTDDSQLQRFMAYLLSCPEFAPPRHKLRHITNIHDVTRLLRCSKRILVLTGAGISVSCGIPDFRSKDGLYSRVSKVFPHLRDPQSVFDIRLFRRDPRPFFLTAKELYPGQFEPSLSHKFIRKLEMRGQLLRNYSQNIDTLETIAGIENVTMCHGSFATATCIRCKFSLKADAIKDNVMSGEIPYCPNCSTPEETNALQYPLASPSPDASRLSQDEEQTRRLSFEDDEDGEAEDYYPSEEPIPPVLKPDIVFFGEDLPDEFHNNLNIDKTNCDLLLVIGSSLRVRPVSLIPGMLPPGVPQILINREPLPHCTFDVELLGNCDAIISQLCHSLGSDFADLANSKELKELDKLPKEFSYPILNNSKEPQSEHDIQALKTCWQPKTIENIAEKLPDNSYLNWRQRQYIFEGAEVELDYDDEDNDDDEDSSSGGSSDSEGNSDSSSSDNRDDDSRSASGFDVKTSTSTKTQSINSSDILLKGGTKIDLDEILLEKQSINTTTANATTTLKEINSSTTTTTTSSVSPIINVNTKDD